LFDITFIFTLLFEQEFEGANWEDFGAQSEDHQLWQDDWDDDDVNDEFTQQLRQQIDSSTTENSNK
jgi:26 proteasome complex subunit DSS1